MPRKIFILLFALLISACAPTTKLAPTFTPTFIITPTSIPSETPTIVPTPTETAIPTKQIIYSICKIESFYNCVIPAEDLANGNYFYWLETLSKPFDQSKIKDIPFAIDKLSFDVGDAIVYNTDHAPNFSDPATAPFHRNVTFGIVLYENNGLRSFDIVQPIEFYDKNDPSHNKWVITVNSYYYGGAYKINPQTDPYVKWAISTWKNSMHITPIITAIRSTNTGVDDPLVQQTFATYPDMQDRIAQFLGGNVSALSGPGIVLQTGAVQWSDGRLK